MPFCLALGETPPRTLGTSGLQIARFFRGLAEQISWVGLVAGAWGLLAGIRKRSVPVLTLAIAVLCLGPLFFLLGNLPFDAQSNGLLERFYIAPTLFWTLLIAAGVWYATERYSPWAGALCLIPILLLLQPARLPAAAGAYPFRNDIRAYAYGWNNLHTLPPHARFIMDGGDDTFYTVAYLTQVEKRRRDIEYHDRGSVVFPGLYGSDFRTLDKTAKDERRQQVERALLGSGQSLFYSTMNADVLPGIKLMPRGIRGILYQVGGALAAFPYWDIYDLRGVAPWTHPHAAVPADYRTRALLPFYDYQRSVQAARESNWNDAINFAADAYAVGSDMLWLVPNVVHNAYQWGQMNYLAGRLDVAERFFRQIAAWNTNASTAWSNLGTIEERRQNVSAAVADYQRALQLDPSSEAAHYNLAVVYWKLNDWPHVIAELKQVLSINPANQRAKNYLLQAEIYGRR